MPFFLPGTAISFFKFYSFYASVVSQTLVVVSAHSYNFSSGHSLLPSCPLRVSLHFLHKWPLNTDGNRKPQKGKLPLLIALTVVDMVREELIDKMFARMSSLAVCDANFSRIFWLT